MHNLDRVFLEFDNNYPNEFPTSAQGGHQQPWSSESWDGAEQAESHYEELAQDQEIYEYEATSDQDFPSVSTEHSQGAWGNTAVVDEADSDSELAEELEFASELLSLTTQEELDQFLGKFIKKAWRKVKKIAKKALPFVAGLVGGPLGGIAGKLIAGGLGKELSDAPNDEMHGLSEEDQRFELARQFVRMGTAAVQELATSAGPAGPAMVGSALSNAARTHAPALANRMFHNRAVSGRSTRPPTRGTWIRQGGKIVLLGL